MSSRRTTAGARTPSVPDTQKLLEQYGCGPIQFTGTADALYERHLLFDNAVDPPAVGARERYEAVARSVRAVLSQRWVRTEKTYERLNPKRVYYLSMEFLIGRSLVNNVMNLLLDREVQRGGWTWYAGSASWLYRVAIETILGSNCGVTHFVLCRACHRAGRDLN
jgi:starch phosphorylase